MGTTFDAIKQAEKDRLLTPDEMRLFDTKSIHRVTKKREAFNPKSNGHAPIPARAVEEYNHLKQSIVTLTPEMTQRALLFASATDGEGNSNVIANFSIVLAAAGEKLLLVDANLRNPVLHDLFGADKDHGFAELLSGQQTLEQVIKPTYLPNLSLITAGSLPQNPSPLFAPAKLDPVIREMKTHAEWVLFDAPAVNAFNDGVALGLKTDGAVLVVRAEKTRWEVAQNARERLQAGKANILGVILNDRKLHIPNWIYKRL
jgi:capsular exopolysaccharide synthesis family protein